MKIIGEERAWDKLSPYFRGARTYNINQSMLGTFSICTAPLVKDVETRRNRLSNNKTKLVFFFGIYPNRNLLILYFVFYYSSALTWIAFPNCRSKWTYRKYYHGSSWKGKILILCLMYAKSYFVFFLLRFSEKMIIDRFRTMLLSVTQIASKTQWITYFNCRFYFVMGRFFSAAEMTDCQPLVWSLKKWETAINLQWICSLFLQCHRFCGRSVMLFFNSIIDVSIAFVFHTGNDSALQHQYSFAENRSRITS